MFEVFVVTALFLLVVLPVSPLIALLLIIAWRAHKRRRTP